MAYLLIDPGETLDYTCDWEVFLEEGGSPSDTISTSAWKIDGGGSPAPSLTSASNTVDSATIFVAGCEPGQVYRLTNTITTAQARTAERSVTLRCEER